MRIAILTDTDSVFVEFSPDQFRSMLKHYIKIHNGDVDKALDEIIEELKRLTITK